MAKKSRIVAISIPESNSCESFHPFVGCSRCKALFFVRLLKDPHVDLQGVSYGGFLAIVAAAQDGENGTERKFHRATVLSPQVQLETTHHKLDDLMRSQAQYLANPNAPWHDQMARSLLADRTQATLSNAVELRLRSPERCSGDTPVEIPKGGYPIRPELRRVGYREAIERYSPENLPLYKEHEDGYRDDDIRYWIKKINENNNPSNPIVVRVITTERDPLNNFEDWKQTGLSEKQLIMLPGRGHVSYIASKLFDELLTEAYSSSPPTAQKK